MKLLIDGDILLYKIGMVYDKPIQFGDDAPIYRDIQEAKDAYTLFISTLMSTLKADRMTLFFTTGKSWRYDVFPKYKGNRPPKPEIINTLKAWALVHYAEDVHCYQSYEADDLLGLHQDILGNTILCSSDKDLLQIPGKHYDWKRDCYQVEDGTFIDNRLFTVSPEEAEKFFWTQVLTGDPTDGYQGLPGVGPAKAKGILEGCESPEDYWAAIVIAYLRHGYTIQDARQQAQLAYILHPWDTYEYRWQPPFDIENDPKYETLIRVLTNKKGQITSNE